MDARESDPNLPDDAGAGRTGEETVGAEAEGAAAERAMSSKTRRGFLTGAVRRAEEYPEVGRTILLLGRGWLGVHLMIDEGHSLCDVANECPKYRHAPSLGVEVQNAFRSGPQTGEGMLRKRGSIPQQSYAS